MHWILSNAETWHAWKQHHHATVCGRIDVDHLRKYPARKISQDLPVNQNVCTSCLRKTGAAISSAGPVAAQWIALIKRHQKHIHARVHEKLIVEMSERLTEIGSPSSLEGQEAFDYVKLVFIRPLYDRKTNSLGHTKSYATFPYLKDALAKLTPGSFQRIITALRYWRNTTNGDLSRARFRPDNIVEAILTLPAPEPYIRHMHAQGLSSFALIFHPNTIERARKDTALRGLFSGSTEYWTETADQLNIVTD